MKSQISDLFSRFLSSRGIFNILIEAALIPAYFREVLLSDISSPLDASSICCIFKRKQWLNVRSFKQATLYFLKTIIRDIYRNQRG